MDKEKYVDVLTMRNKLARAVWMLFACLFIRPFAGPLFRYYRSAVLRLWGAKIGRRCAIAAGAKIWAPWNFEVGDYVAIANGAEIYNVAKIVMKNHITISQDSYLCTASHDIAYKLKPLIFQSITVESYSWYVRALLFCRG